MSASQKVSTFPKTVATRLLKLRSACRWRCTAGDSLPYDSGGENVCIRASRCCRSCCSQHILPSFISGRDLIKYQAHRFACCSWWCRLVALHTRCRKAFVICPGDFVGLLHTTYTAILSSYSLVSLDSSDLETASSIQEAMPEQDIPKPTVTPVHATPAPTLPHWFENWVYHL